MATDSQANGLFANSGLHLAERYLGLPRRAPNQSLIHSKGVNNTRNIVNLVAHHGDPVTCSPLLHPPQACRAVAELRSKATQIRVCAHAGRLFNWIGSGMQWGPSPYKDFFGFRREDLMTVKMVDLRRQARTRNGRLQRWARLISEAWGGTARPGADTDARSTSRRQLGRARMRHLQFTT